MSDVRTRLQTALAKPLPETDMVSMDEFDPWQDVIRGIHGSYAGKSDALMIAALEAVRDGTTFDLIEREGFAAEFILYVLSGHGFTEYGTSPRGAWAAPEVSDLWSDLIEKWKAYSRIVWKEDVSE